MNAAAAKKALGVQRWIEDEPWAKSLERLVSQPTINIEGLVGGYTGPGGTSGATISYGQPRYGKSPTWYRGKVLTATDLDGVVVTRATYRTLDGAGTAAFTSCQRARSVRRSLRSDATRATSSRSRMGLTRYSSAPASIPSARASASSTGVTRRR